MVMLVHLAPRDEAARIRRSGLSVRRSGAEVRGVYTVPMLPDHAVTHQWLREVKRWKAARTMVAVDVRVPDDEAVLVGHYSRPHLEVTAAEAVRIVMEADDPRGYEVVVPRSIRAAEVHRIRELPQKIGWRFWPDAHGTRPCGCPVCLTPGQPGAARFRQEYEDL